MSKSQGESFLKEESKKQSPEQGGVSGTSGTIAADVDQEELFKVDSIKEILEMDKDFKCASESSGEAASKILNHLRISAEKEGFIDYNFMETPSLRDLSGEQKRFLTLCGQCFFCCSAEWRRELFPAFLSSVQGVLLINSSQLHIIADEHLLKTTGALNYMFFSDDEYRKHPEKNYPNLITIVEDLNAVVVCCSGEKKASEFLKKHKFRPVDEFFLKKQQRTYLYFDRIYHPVPTEMIKEVIVAPESTETKNRKRNGVESSEQENTTGLRLTKNSDGNSYSNHCLSMVWDINALYVDRSVLEILPDVLSLVTAPQRIWVDGEDADACNAKLTKNLVKNIKFTNRLETLILKSINLTANEAAFIAESLYKVPNLLYLDLSFNPLLGEGVSFITENLSSVPDLKALWLYDVKMTRKQADDLTTAVHHSKISNLWSSYHDDEGNIKPEGKWPPEHYWKENYPSLFPDSSSEPEDNQQQGGWEERVHQDEQLPDDANDDDDDDDGDGGDEDDNEDDVGNVGSADITEEQELSQQFHGLQLEGQEDHLEEQDQDKTKIDEEIVTSEGTYWPLKQGAVHLMFPANAVSEPTTILVHKWICSACSPPLQDHEAIVSNVIEISTINGEALEFNAEVKLFLSHSAPDLKGYEMVLKRQIDKECNEWEDVDGTHDLRSLSDIGGGCPSPNDIPDFFFPVVQAGITKCSIYTVVCRLKLSPSYTITSAGGVFSHPDFPGVTVTIPENAVAPEAKFPLQLKVQEVPNEECEDVFLGPVLRIVRSQVHFLKPVTIQLPVSLRDEREGIPDPLTCLVRVFFLRTGDGEHKECIEITDDLLNPASFDGTFVRFQVERFCGYLPVLDRHKEKSSVAVIGSYLSRYFWPTPIMPFFIAYFDPYYQNILLLICCPAHLRSEVMSELKGKDITPRDVSSMKDMVPKYDKAFVFVSGGITPYRTEDMEEIYLVLRSDTETKTELKVRFVSNKDLAQVEFYSTSKPPRRTLLCKLHLKVPSLSVDRTVSEEPAHQQRAENTNRRFSVEDAATIQTRSDTQVNQENKSPETASDPPEITVTLLKKEDLPKRSKPWDDIQLPVDILLLAVKECAFLACLSYLNPDFFKSYTKVLGNVYLGDMGEDKLKLRIAVMQCDVGSTCPGSSAVVVLNAVRALMPKAVFCVGLCGGLNFNKVKLGDVVVLKKLITYAHSKVTENGIEEQGVKVPLKPLLSKLTLSPDEGWKAPLKDPKDLKVQVHRGVVLSGPEVIDSSERRKALIKRFPEAIAIEMEGEGLYAAAYDMDIEWIVIKGISDYADGRKSETDSWKQFASLMAASLTAHILSDTIVFQDWHHYGSTREFVNRRRYEQGARNSPSTSLQDSVPHGEGNIKDGVVTDDDLKGLSLKLGEYWIAVAWGLKFGRAERTAFKKQNNKDSEKAFNMLKMWKKENGLNATYRVLYDAMCHERVDLKNLAREFCT